MRLTPPTTERDLRSHLSLVHGTYVRDLKTLDALAECHQSQHEEPDYHFQLKHTHTFEESLPWE